MIHVVCYSGGVSSALVGAMVIQRYGRENTIWINHQVMSEPEDVERFEKEFATAHDMEITYVNGDTGKYPKLTPKDVFLAEGAISVKHGGGENTLCTNRLKTQPFYDWLEFFHPEELTVYYGFDMEETSRIKTRSGLLGAKGIRTDFPLAFWTNPLTPNYLKAIKIEKPKQYEVMKHANCVPCAKGKLQHFLVVYVHRHDLFNEWAEMEEQIGHSILPEKYGFLNDIRDYFQQIAETGLPITEKIPAPRFWANIKRALKGKELLPHADMEMQSDPMLPCECII